MMQDEIVDILLRAGIPASTKGFTYIHDALELMDRDSYYFSGKVCALYAKIAKQNGANSSQVERAIRYAFEEALTRGEPGVGGALSGPHQYSKFQRTQGLVPAVEARNPSD